jgi:putative ABC transport system permease protein
MELYYLWQKLKTEKIRIALTIFGLVWGTLTIMLMLATTHGFMQATEESFKRNGINTVTISHGETSEAVAGISQASPVELDFQDYQEITNALSQWVTHATPVYNISTSISTFAKHQKTPVLGVNDAYQNLNVVELTPGSRFINQEDLQHHKPVIVLSNDSASMLFSNPDQALGQYVYLHNTAFQVIGVTAEKTKYSFFSRQSWIPYTTFQSLFPNPYLNEMMIDFKNHADHPLLERTIRWIVAKNHHVSMSDQSIVMIQDNQAMMDAGNTMLEGIQIFFAIVGVVTLFAASLSVVSLMFTAVKNDQIEIGLRIALGSKSKSILRYYLLQSLLIVVIGGITGILLSLLCMILLNSAHISIPIMHIKHLRFTLSIPLLMAVVVMLGVLGLLASYFPARRAANMNPVVALRNLE